MITKTAAINDPSRPFFYAVAVLNITCTDLAWLPEYLDLGGCSVLTWRPENLRLGECTSLREDDS